MPMAPARIAVSMIARIRSSSAAVGARAERPTTATRVCVSLKYVPKFMLIPCRSSVAKSSGDRDVGGNPGIALTVEDAAVADDDVVQRIGSLRTRLGSEGDGERDGENELSMH